MTELERFKEELKTKTKRELLDLLYTVKRSKDPEKHALIEEAFRDEIQAQIDRKELEKWANALLGSFVRIRGHAQPVKIVEVRLNTRGSAAIVRLEGEERNRYFAYRKEE